MTVEDWRVGVTFHRRETMLVTIVVMTLSLISASFTFGNAEGATTNKTVLGYIWDQSGNPLPDVPVTVEIWGGYWPDQDFFRTSVSTTTDAWGYYEVTINGNYWDPHNTIKLVVTIGSVEDTHKEEANEEQYQTVNMFVSSEIPEFGGPYGLAVMIMGCMALIFILLVRRAKKSWNPN